MRRAKADLMKSAINSYLKRRRYSEVEETFKVDNASLFHSSQQMAIMGIVDKELCRSNSVTFSSIANDKGREVDHQFSRLKNWIAYHKADNYRYELAALLCPLFCHLYLEMLCGNHLESATEFFMRHQALFASRENSRKLLEELSCVSTSQDIEINSYIKSFRSGKYRLKLSTKAMIALQRYLSEHGHLLMLQTLQKWFDVEIVPAIKPEKEDEDVGNVTSNKTSTEDEDSQNSTSKEDDALKKVLEVIKAVEEQPLAPSPLLLYVISNVLQNSCRVYCTKIDESVSLLAAGLNNTIKLWGLSRKLCSQANSTPISLQTKHSQTASLYEEECKDKFAVSLYGHVGPVQDIAFVPGSSSPSVLLSVSQDATMRSWRLDSYECVATYRGHNHPIWCVDVSSLGLFVATGSRDRTARVWSLDRNFPLRTCAGHHLDVESIKFHPNNLYFATGSADKTVKMWSVNDSRLLRLFFGHRGAIRSLAFSPDGKFLASSAEDKRIKIWDLTAGKLFKELDGHSSAVLSLAWDKTNEYISSCSTDGTVRLWNVNSPESTTETPTSDLLRTYTIGNGVFSVQYSISNTLVCIAVS